MICSMSRKGNCWDNAPTESWFNSFKNDQVHRLCYETRAEMTAMSFEYIEVLYNRGNFNLSLFDFSYKADSKCAQQLPDPL